MTPAAGSLKAGCAEVYQVAPGVGPVQYVVSMVASPPPPPPDPLVVEPRQGSSGSGRWVGRRRGWRPGWVLLVAFCLFASVLVVVPVGGSVLNAQDQTSWYVNDNPQLNGPSQYWHAGTAGKGYGSNNYVYTYGIAGESSPDNWARWSMGRRVGRQEIQVYVPHATAAATVLYRIDIGGSEFTKRVVQLNEYGWTSLGRYDVDGNQVTITLRDNDASQHWNREGYSASRIGVDAAAMRCIARCSTTQPTPTATPGPGVIITPVPENNDNGLTHNVYVHLCSGGNARYDDDDLQEQVRNFNNSGVSEFFNEESGGLASFNFIKGEIHQVDMENVTTMNQVRIRGRTNLHPCDEKATSIAKDETQQILMLVDVDPTSDAWGYAYVNEKGSDSGYFAIGRAFVPTIDRFTSNGLSVGQYDIIVAHELGHSVFAMVHTSDKTHNGKRFDGNAPEIRGSIMNWTFHEVEDLSDVRVFCINRKRAQWECDPSQSDPFGETTQQDSQSQPVYTAPSVPRSVRAVAHGEQQIRVSWSVPSDNGGSAISHYRVRYSRPAIGSLGSWSSTTTVRSGTNHTSGNLRRGVTYTVEVTAVNQAGHSSNSAQSAATTNRATAPSVPRSVRAVAHGEQQIRVSWSVPSDNGGSAISHYRVRYSRPAIGSLGSWSSTTTVRSGTNHTSGNLRRGVTYTVEVTAVNQAGRSSDTVQTAATTNQDTMATAANFSYQKPPTKNVPITATVEESLKKSPGTSFTKTGTNCNRFGNLCLGGDFYVTSRTGATAEWYMGDLQGTFTFGRDLPKLDDTTGRMEWKIYERRTNNNEWRLVQTYRPASQENRSGWYTYRQTPLELDGQIVVTAQNIGGTVGVNAVKLVHIDLLPEHREAAIALCRKEVGEFYQLSKPDQFSLILDGLNIGGSVYDVLAAGRLTVGTKLALAVAAFELGWYGSWWLFENISPGITLSSAQALAYNCKDFDYNIVAGLGLVRGYHVFADDIATHTAQSLEMTLSSDPQDTVYVGRRT